MSYFDPNDKRNIDDEKLKYNYTSVDIHSYDVREHTNGTRFEMTHKLIQKIPVEGEHIYGKDAFFKINFPSKTNNFSYNGIKPSSYRATKAYIYGTLHNNVMGMPDDVAGELVIEHENNIDSNKVYTCFFLKRDVGHEKNSFDEMMHMIIARSFDANTHSKHMKKYISRMKNEDLGKQLMSKYGNEKIVNLDLNDVIPDQKKCFRYASRNHNVFVFMKPITIDDMNAGFIEETLAQETKLFSLVAPLSTQVIKLDEPEGDLKESMANMQSSPVKNGSFIESVYNRIFGTQEGMEDGAYECELVGTNEDTDDKNMVAVKSDIGGLSSGNYTYHTITSVLVSIVLLVSLNFAVPAYINSAVIGHISGMSDKLHKLMYYAVISVICLILICVFLLLSGDAMHWAAITTVLSVLISAIFLYHYETFVTTLDNANIGTNNTPVNRWLIGTTALLIGIILPVILWLTQVIPGNGMDLAAMILGFVFIVVHGLLLFTSPSYK